MKTEFMAIAPLISPQVYLGLIVSICLVASAIIWMVYAKTKKHPAERYGMSIVFIAALVAMIGINVFVRDTPEMKAARAQHVAPPPEWRSSTQKPEPPAKLVVLETRKSHE